VSFCQFVCLSVHSEHNLPYYMSDLYHFVRVMRCLSLCLSYSPAAAACDGFAAARPAAGDIDRSRLGPTLVALRYVMYFGLYG